MFIMTKLILVVGTPGAGKSTLLQGLASANPAVNTVNLGDVMLQVARDREGIGNRENLGKMSDEQIRADRESAFNKIITGGREQLAIQAFADALEVIPKALADSSGMDPIDTLVQLRSKHKGNAGRNFGVDVYGNVTSDMEKLGVIEPLKVKSQAINSATEAAVSILRIDDMISSKGTKPSAGPGGAGGMPGGMGGMED